MLSKPKHGWTDFSLEGTSTYGLSYLDDIAFEWLDQAIHGLQTMLPFCVKGFLEPNRFLCVVSYWNCHIIIEDDGKDELTKEDIIVECSHTSMLDFCKNLYSDISNNIDEWVRFVDYEDCSEDEKRGKLHEKLTALNNLMSLREREFHSDRGFM